MHSVIFVMDMSRDLFLLQCQNFTVRKMRDVQAVSR